MLAKPESRKRQKAREKRQDAKALARVYVEVSDRDGYCRLYVLDRAWRATIWDRLGPCAGPSQFAHFGDLRRFKTRHKPPEERHTRAGALKLCQAHHEAYDQHRLAIDALTDRGTDGRLRFARAAAAWEEEA